jgi:hypothetical protein
MTSILEQQYAFRTELMQRLHRDLIGPDSPKDTETITDPPLTRYICGMLYPTSADAPEQDDRDNEAGGDIGEEEDQPDPPVAMANVRFPSSMGMTFAVDTHSCKEIIIKPEASRYEEEQHPTEDAEAATVQGGNKKRRERRANPWIRKPLHLDPLRVEINSPTSGEKKQIAPGLMLFYRVRPRDDRGAAAVTVVLFNKNVSVPGKLRDADSFFQVRLTAEPVDTNEAVFVERPRDIAIANDEDLRSYRLLYRHAASFAVGHGCSVDWKVLPSDKSRATEIHTDFAPHYDLLLSDSNPELEGFTALGMRFLGTADRALVIAALRDLATGYKMWIDQTADAAATNLSGDLLTTAASHLKFCREAQERIVDGINVLEGNGKAWKAFQLANRAMLHQRARTEWLKTNKTSSAPVESDELRWRPFQLAFQLLCVKGIVDPTAERDGTLERDIVDLLWFPTGGGKTEAYLGLVAFTVFFRRLHFGVQGGGVTVIMRYTLRLLTIQQFERAALLICCCERLRQGDPELGSEPISIGLWVGQGATPNKLDDARRALDKLRRSERVTEKNPMQLQRCIWCGKGLTALDYFVTDSNRRLVIRCNTQGCEFRQALPVWVVDEDIYNRRPTMLIATVDKFASLPWEERTGELFNIGRNALPPELIIQDELHLISGPLGTLTGLYETAVDDLCSNTQRRPKVVASTATIRRAESQNKGLFCRSSRQFPPPGTTARDSYFAVEVSADRKATRMYMGLMAPGTSHSTLMIRTYACLLQFVSESNVPVEVKDPYWTMVGYFNSLRVLGGARMQVQDDVADYISVLAGRSGKTERVLENERLIELTSRESSDAIPGHLTAMAVRLPADAVSVILATNMISVGVDVDRLGLMVVMGQPQATSEYIQATSRVGRMFPGLVVTLFNSSRSRDRSHYESFVTYHSALYRQVESSSVTPFSSRARDRALHAVLVAMARLETSKFRDNAAASRVQTLDLDVTALKSKILDRIKRVAPDERDAAEAQLDEIVRRWTILGTDNSQLVFSKFNNINDSLLVEASLDTPAADERFRTLWSLRDVDKSSDLYLVM